ARGHVDDRGASGRGITLPQRPQQLSLLALRTPQRVAPEGELAERATVRRNAARDLLDRGAARLERQADLDPRLRNALQLEVAEMNLLLERPEVAEPIARSALELARSASPREPGAEAQALYLLSWTEDVRGHYPEAEKLARAALASAAPEIPPNDIRHAYFRTALGSPLQALDRAEEAAVEFAEAVRILRLAGDSRISLANSLQGLGIARLDLGDLAGAEAATREALQVLVDTFGEDDLHTAWVRNNLGRILERRGELTEAHGFYDSSLEMKRKLYGPEHPSVAVALHNLARLDAGMGNWEEAATINDEAYRIRYRALGADHPLTSQTLVNQGLYDAERLHLESGLKHLQQGADLSARRLGEASRQTTIARVYAGSVSLDLGRLGEASLFADAAVRQLAGPAPRDRVTAAMLLGRLALAEGRADEGLRFLERAVAEGSVLGEPLFRPAREAEFRLALEQVRSSGVRAPTPELLAAANAVRDRSPRMRLLVETGLDSLNPQ
ncbi:MAG: tetratricopeptide repeat protein, partial [Thermoanaerobaculia bacterium]